MPSTASPTASTATDASVTRSRISRRFTAASSRPRARSRSLPRRRGREACGAAGRCRCRACSRGRSRRPATLRRPARGAGRPRPGARPARRASRNSVGVSGTLRSPARMAWAAGSSCMPPGSGGCGAALGSPSQRVDTDQQLGERERLGEVVVPARAEAGEPVGQRTARGEEQHRRLHARVRAGPGRRRARRSRGARCRGPVRRAGRRRTEQPRRARWRSRGRRSLRRRVRGSRTDRSSASSSHRPTLIRCTRPS